MPHRNATECNSEGLHTSTEAAFLLLTQWPWVRFSAFLKIYFYVAETYWWRRLYESGQRLKNVDQTPLLLSSGRLVLQKIASIHFWFQFSSYHLMSERKKSESWMLLESNPGPLAPQGTAQSVRNLKLNKKNPQTSIFHLKTQKPCTMSKHKIDRMIFFAVELKLSSYYFFYLPIISAKYWAGCTHSAILEEHSLELRYHSIRKRLLVSKGKLWVLTR